MGCWQKFWLKSFSVFVGAVTLTGGIHRVTGQVSLYDWLALVWPGVLALGVYWGLVADETPAPWTPADKLHEIALKAAEDQKSKP